jgi:hypothetical protein
MTVPTDVSVEPELAGFDLLVATLIKALADSRDAGAHRTTLLALVQTGLANQTLGRLDSSQGVGRLRALLADALVSLRARGVVRMDDDGFHLTDLGITAMELALQSDHEDLPDKVSHLLRQQSRE